MQLFYIADLHESSTEFTFDKIESRHIIKVLRKKEGSVLHITNGKNYLFEGKIIIADDKKCQIQITEIKKQKSLRNYKIQIAIAPTKSNDRFEWFLEKATEIGVDEIQPIICAHSERKVIKTDRLKKVVLSAMKQSLQFQLPILRETITFKEYISQNFDNQQTSFNQGKFIAHCEKTTKNSLKKLLQPTSETLILIGPEGDFSTEEIELALQNDFIPVSLGATRLRTETAGIVAVHTAALVNEMK
jgi:16S rRNA (uracil1498-N3)-methyltransferase